MRCEADRSGCGAGRDRLPHVHERFGAIEAAAAERQEVAERDAERETGGGKPPAPGDLPPRLTDVDFLFGVEVRLVEPPPPSNLLAQRVVSELSPYVDVRIRTYEARLESLEASINAVTASITALQDTIDEARRENTFTGLQRLELISQLANDETRRAQLVANQSDNLQLLEFARNIERPRIIEEAVPRQTTARSVRNSVLVGALIGLILGTLAALLADRFVGRGGRRLA